MHEDDEDSSNVKLSHMHLNDTYDQSMVNDQEISSQSKKKPFTIGLLGHPNVGKSSFLNSLLGRSVVSCSKTPGHTKHFQTIFWIPTLRLCDGPGIVVPSTIPHEVQVIAGMFKVAQVRDPWSCVKWVAERIDLVKELRIESIIKVKSKESSLSAWIICEAYAMLKGFNTAKGGRPDVWRAANLILRMVCEGKISWWMRPPHGLEIETEWMKTSSVSVPIGDKEEMLSTSSMNHVDNENDSGKSESSGYEIEASSFQLLADDGDNE